MSIQFSCEKCGHEIEVNESFAGKHGVCKHCGHALVVPGSTRAATEPSLHLRPIEAEEPEGRHGHLLDPHSALFIRPTTAEPHTKPDAISGPDEPVSSSRGDYRVSDPGEKRPSSAGPPPFWVLVPSLCARSLARQLRSIRDAIYLVSLAALVFALLGFTFKVKGMLHGGVVVAIAANIGMLVVGISYLLVLPFKEGLRYGLANVLIPFYAVYYWYTRWPKMKAAVRGTFRSFVPILLAGAAYLGYEDGPKLVEIGERETPIIEKKIEEGVKKLEVGPVRRIEEKIEGTVNSGEEDARRRSR